MGIHDHVEYYFINSSVNFLGLLFDWERAEVKLIYKDMENKDQKTIEDEEKEFLLARIETAKKGWIVDRFDQYDFPPIILPDGFEDEEAEISNVTEWTRINYPQVIEEMDGKKCPLLSAFISLKLLEKISIHLENKKNILDNLCKKHSIWFEGKVRERLFDIDWHKY